MSTPTVAELEATLGVVLIGYVVAMVGFGVTVFHTYVYFSRYADDSAWMKVMVGSLCFLDAITTTLVSHAIYYYLISQYPFTDGLENATSTYSAALGISAVALLIVQLYYAYYTRQCGSGRKLACNGTIVSVSITLTALAAFALGLVVAVNLVRDSSFASLTQGSARIIMVASQSLVFISGLLTAGTLTYYRHSMNPSSPPLAPVKKFFDEEAIMTLVSHGALSAVFQLSFVAVFAAYPSKALWMPFQFLASKVFTNSMLVLHNSRPHHGELEGDRSDARLTSAVLSFKPKRSEDGDSNLGTGAPGDYEQQIKTSRRDLDIRKQSIKEDTEDSKQLWQDEIEVEPTSSPQSNA